MTISSKPRIIGLSGTFASGKDTLAKLLTQQYGYFHLSTSNMVREEAMKQFGNSERPTCHIVAKKLREEQGAGIFVKKALAQSRQSEIVISGIRTTGEADEIRNVGGVVVFVDADTALRYERMKSRKRDKETQLTFEEFQVQEAREWQAGDKPSDFNLKKVKETADVVLENNMDLESFLKNAKEGLCL